VESTIQRQETKMSDTIPDGGGFDDDNTDETTDEGFSDARDPERLAAESMDTVTNDAVGGETVEPGLGDGNDGPTGGAPGEDSPYFDDNDLEGEEIVGLDDSGPSGPVIER
jgi:hypothetical protein